MTEYMHRLKDAVIFSGALPGKCIRICVSNAPMTTATKTCR